MEFTNKIIWIISTERWGILKVSKHHYAIELVKKNNKVLFVEPPDLTKPISGHITLAKEGIHVLRYKPLARGRKYLGRKIYSFLQRIQLTKIAIKNNIKPDIVWCFSDGIFDDLRIFGAALIIFHPVDHNLSRKTPICAKYANVVFSTSPEILKYMKPDNKPGIVINHGLNDHFVNYALKRKEVLSRDGKFQFRNVVGFWGSLFKESLDRKKVISLVTNFPYLKFIFFGPYELKQNNVGGKFDEEIFNFISELKSQPNVILKGALASSEIVKEIDSIDLYINIEFEASRRWDNGNPHKVLEYLSTGKVVFTTPMVMYKNSDLFFFCDAGDVVFDFKKLLSELNNWNSTKEQNKRLDFALNNTYAKQVERIEKFITAN